MSVSNVKSASRALEVLSFLSGSSSPVPAVVIARSLDMPRSSTYHLLNVMLERGFVSRLDEGTWSLGPEACDMGRSQARDDALRRASRSLMGRLASTTGIPALLAVPYGSDARIIAREDPGRRSANDVPQVGERLPVHLSALGRALLMTEPDARIRAMFPFPDLPTLTPKSPRHLSELLALLERARACGYAVERSEVGLGRGALAAPVFDRLGYAAAAIGVSFWAGGENLTRAHEIGDLVAETAEALSTRLGASARMKVS